MPQAFSPSFASTVWFSFADIGRKPLTERTMKNSGGQKRGLTSRMVFGTLVIFVTSVWLYSSGDVFNLQVNPMAVDALPGQLVTISVARPEATLDVDVMVRLESLNPDIARVVQRASSSPEVRRVVPSRWNLCGRFRQYQGQRRTFRGKGIHHQRS